MRLLAWDWWRARPAVTGSAVLVLLYGATLAPSLTLWDSGEFLAAIHSLGIPHPPGTPLFVFAARAWTEVLRIALPFDVAVNLASALATAIACGLLAHTLLPPGGARFHAAVIGGIASSVWASATEAEVYAWALLLMALMMHVGNSAGRRGDHRRTLLLAFLFGLAVPLHISALLAGPAAIMLAGSNADGAISWRALSDAGAAWLLAVGLGTLSGAPVAGAMLLVVWGYVLRVRGGARGASGLAVLALVALGATFVVVMRVRAQHDPFVNQGNASTWASLLDVIGRRQYDVPGLLPRRAPLWLQVGNVVQYMDWQFGRALSASVGPSLWRTPITIALLLLGVGGAIEHRRSDRRTFLATALFAWCASLGVVGVLNLRAGPSYGWGILPDGAVREARERDYFFAAFFVVWGVWAALGLWRIVHQRTRGALGFAVPTVATAALVLSNYAGVDRRRHPDAVLARTLARATLAGTPENAVLFLAGDNDAYATWHAQAVERARPDVATIVVPLLPARWYRAEIARRHALLGPADTTYWRGTEVVLQAIGGNAARLGRPVATSVALPSSERRALGMDWRLTGLTFVRDGAGLSVDSSATARTQDVIAAQRVAAGPSEHPDPTVQYLLRLMGCPGAALARQAGEQRRDALLESTCNYR